MSTIEAVLFDMDGVVVDSERYWDEIKPEILEAALGSLKVSPEEVTGMNVLDQYDYLSENFDVEVSREEYFDLYDGRAEEVYTERSELMDGFHDLLDELDERGVTVTLTSSSFPHWIEMVLERFDLDGRFDEIVTGEDIDGASKPEPDIYRHTADLVGVDPERCAVVEDSEHGVEAADRAGTHCVGYRTDVNEGQDLSRADEVVESPEELRETLLSLTSS